MIVEELSADDRATLEAMMRTEFQPLTTHPRIWKTSARKCAAQEPIQAYPIVLSVGITSRQRLLRNALTACGWVGHTGTVAGNMGSRQKCPGWNMPMPWM